MLNMGFADDVERVLDGAGSVNEEKPQVLLFSATTPDWVQSIASQYQQDAKSIDSTKHEKGARTAKTVRHVAIQIPPNKNDRAAMLEDIIAVEISKDVDNTLDTLAATEDSDHALYNPIAVAVAQAKASSAGAVQQKIFGKTIVFVQTKRDADELVSGGVFKSLTAQALHGDVGQKQRDATLAAFRAGSFNVLVATDVAARGIDIADVDLVIQYEPPRDTDTYVHRSGRTGRAGRKGTSILLFTNRESRDIVRIERSLGHGFKFELTGPPTAEAALKAASKTSALACLDVPAETAAHFVESASSLLAAPGVTPEDVVSRCLAAISKRTTFVKRRSLLTGEEGYMTIEMSSTRKDVSPGDVMFAVSKLATAARDSGVDPSDLFEADVGKIQSSGKGKAVFDMGSLDGEKLLKFAKGSDGIKGFNFGELESLAIDRELLSRGGFSRGGGGDLFTGN